MLLATTSKIELMLNQMWFLRRGQISNERVGKSLMHNDTCLNSFEWMEGIGRNKDVPSLSYWSVNP